MKYYTEQKIKKCSKCHQTKSLNEFYKDKSKKDKKTSSCVQCIKNNKSEYVYSNEHKQAVRRWYANNKERHYQLVREWRNKNKEKLKILNREESNKRRSTIKGKLKDNICRGINISIKSGSKNKRKWEYLVGYSVDKLKKHLEKQFKNGMTWSNYGRNGWHIDHIIPISAFNFETPEDIDFKKCWALSNLQPMWEVDNIKKSNKIDIPFQPSLLMGVL